MSAWMRFSAVSARYHWGVAAQARPVVDDGHQVRRVPLATGIHNPTATRVKVKVPQGMHSAGHERPGLTPLVPVDRAHLARRRFARHVPLRPTAALHRSSDRHSRRHRAVLFGISSRNDGEVVRVQLVGPAGMSAVLPAEFTRQRR